MLVSLIRLALVWLLLLGTDPASAQFALTGGPNGTGMARDASNANLTASSINLGLTSIYAKNYGAKANRVNVSADLNVSASSAAATTTTTTFTSADVNKLIIIAGAGASGNALITTISAVTGAHAITLGATASTSVTNANFEYATNDTAAIASAISAAIGAYPNAARVVLPAGGYIINPAVSRVLLSSNVILDGEGAANIRCASIVDSATYQNDACIVGVSVNNVEVRGLTVKGMADLTPTLSPQALGAPIYFNASNNIRIDRNVVTYTRGYGITVSAGTTISITDNTVSYTLSNGIAAGENDIVIAHNHLDHNADAAISTGTADSLPAPSGGRGVVIDGNVITESIGIEVSGARSIAITNNTLVRALGPGIYVAPFASFGSGDTPTSAVTITGNTVLDDINPAPGSALVDDFNAYLVVNAGQRQAGTGASIPGYPVVTTGVVTDLYGTNTSGNFFVNGTNTSTVPTPGGIAWTIKDNVFARTLPPVATYSQWGYGSGMWQGTKVAGNGITNRGTPYTGAIAESDLEINCMVVAFGALRLSQIDGNVCATTGNYGLYFLQLAPPNGQYDGLTVRGNTFYDYNTAGVNFAATSDSSSQISIESNEFNADPRFRNANRGTGGTWAAGTTPIGISSAHMSGLHLDGNKYRNLADPYALGTTSVSTGSNETIYGIPAAAGFSTSNIGVGAVSGITGASNRFKLVCEDGDPRNATFGTITAVTGQVSAAQPTTGCWLRGTFVAIRTPVVDANGRTLIGWTRLTTGSGNVAETDWQPTYSGAVTVLSASFISGFVPAAGGNNTSVSLGAGSANDSTGAVAITNASACPVDLATVGAGGLNTGSIAASTWYAFFAISKTDGTASCLGIATTAAAVPAMASIPAGYTYYRYVARAKTDGSSHILAGTILPYGQYYVDASDTWTQAAAGTSARSVRFLACGGGGSGGSGGRQVSGTAISGGAGGSGGGCEDITYPADLLPSTLSVTVGAGGSTVNPPGTDNTAGTTGNAGNPSFVGAAASTAYAYGEKGCASTGGQLNAASASGGGGKAGVNSIGISGCSDASGSTPGTSAGGVAGSASTGGFATVGGLGATGGGSTAAGAASVGGTASARFACPGGGSGGGVTSAPAAVNGGNPGFYHDSGIARAVGGTAGTPAGGAGSAAWAVFLPGGAGAGGYGNSAGTSGDGGAGAQCAGGGGGGSTLNGNVAGKGGAGGGGFVFIWEQK